MSGFDVDLVFKALADPTRRVLLDRLRADDGQTLGALCADLGMARQSVTQHLGILADAGLITTVRRGREKLHYLNPVPIHDIQRRWISSFAAPRLALLDEVRRSAEETPMTGKPRYVYVTYIEATPERVWEALTSADLTAAFWGHRNVSDWQVGSAWEHVRTDDSGVVDVAGTVLVSDPPRRLVFTFDDPGAERPEGLSTVAFDIEAHRDIVKLTLTHENIPDQEFRDAISEGWPAILANLKSLLETGSPLPTAPWEMHAQA